MNHALQVRPGSPRAEYQVALAEIGMGNLNQATKTLEALVKRAPTFVEAHVSLAMVCYRLHDKQEGAREMAIVAKLNAEFEARQTAQVMRSKYHGATGPPEPRAQDALPGSASHKP